MTDQNRVGPPGRYVPMPMNNPPPGHPFYRPPIHHMMSGGMNPGLVPPPGVGIPPVGGACGVGGWIGPPPVGNIMPGGVVPPPGIGVRLGPPPSIPPAPMEYSGGSGGVVPPPVVPIQVAGGGVVAQGTSGAGADGGTTWGVGSLRTQRIMAAAARPAYRPPPLKIVGPKINVYVGQLTPDVPCETIQAMLKCCGRLEKWNRAQDPVTSQPKKFGFATFRSGQEAARAVKFLNGLEVKGTELLVKVGKKDQELVEQAIQSASQDGEEGKNLEKEEEGVLEKIRELAAGPKEIHSAEGEAKNIPTGDSKRGEVDKEAEEDKESEDGVDVASSRFLNSVLVLKNGQGSEDEDGNTSDGYIDSVKAKMAFSEAVKFRRAQVDKERRNEEKRREELQRRIGMQRREAELRAKEDSEHVAAIDDDDANDGTGSSGRGVEKTGDEPETDDSSSPQQPPLPPPPPLPPLPPTADLPGSTNSVEEIIAEEAPSHAPPSIDPAEEERCKRRRLEVLARLGNDDLSGVDLSLSSAAEPETKSLTFSMAGTGKNGSRRGSKNTTAICADAGDEVHTPFSVLFTYLLLYLLFSEDAILSML